ncbi:hypothetical protein Hsw_1493 [Hymenobacter swuensis DY53]|uniref:Uncharacterized protein n=1 Tax=Hymenobacter swuensis DY53 TaxID=1227739 RepID=W8EWZ4_9BACT|nr:hypothetical protein Hsw_1493 [Hymenobacter swuensis DY53]
MLKFMPDALLKTIWHFTRVTSQSGFNYLIYSVLFSRSVNR